MFKQKIISKSKELGFSLIGFSQFQLLEKETESLRQWLAESFQAGMKYMEKNLDKRTDVREILPECKSIISLGMNYYIDEPFENIKNGGKVSRYAWGKDYHLVMWERLDELIECMLEINPGVKAVSYVDTGPVMDKAWAVKSGLGWQGKHSNIINKEEGSWFFIANIFTDQEFDSYNIPVSDFCGSCTACIDACPTQAIVEDYVVDSNKCISYLTIENKNEISDEFLGKFEDWIFGCDVCQEVCPWNVKFAEETGVFEFISHKTKHITFDDIKDISNRAFREKYGESPILRAKAKGMKRNADFLQKSLNLNEDK